MTQSGSSYSGSDYNGENPDETDEADDADDAMSDDSSTWRRLPGTLSDDSRGSSSGGGEEVRNGRGGDPAGPLTEAAISATASFFVSPGNDRTRESFSEEDGVVTDNDNVEVDNVDEGEGREMILGLNPGNAWGTAGAIPLRMIMRGADDDDEDYDYDDNDNTGNDYETNEEEKTLSSGETGDDESERTEEWGTGESRFRVSRSTSPGGRMIV